MPRGDVRERPEESSLSPRVDGQRKIADFIRFLLNLVPASSYIEGDGARPISRRYRMSWARW